MRAERFAPSRPERAVLGSGTLILAAIGCFTIGFVALMAVPRFWPRTVETPVVSDAQAEHPREVGVAAPPPLPASKPAPGVITEVKPNAVAATQKIAAFGVLANLAECKAAIRAGETYEKVGPDQMEAMFGTRGKPLTNAQLDAGCRKLTE